MPKFDYTNSCIYKLYVDDHPHVYIGSTTLPLQTRLSLHKSQYKAYELQRFAYLTSFEIFKLNPDVKIEKVKDCSHVTNSEDLHREEGQVIRDNITCVNKLVSGRTRREWREDMKLELAKKRKEYYQTHKDKAKTYYEANREARIAYQRAYNLRRKGILVVD